MTVGVIGDSHEPFVHPKYYQFCRDVFDYYKVDKIVHIGDLVDNHAISYHETDPDGFSPGDEGLIVENNLEYFFETFPEGTLLLGNHDRLPERKAKTYGLPKRFIKGYRDVWNVPDSWDIGLNVEIDGVHYCHGIGVSGVNGARNLAIARAQSVVIGHLHTFAGVSWIANQDGIHFALNVGCGIDQEEYAFEYAKDYRWKPTLGCGIVKDGQQAMFIPMAFPRYSKNKRR